MFVLLVEQFLIRVSVVKIAYQFKIRTRTSAEKAEKKSAAICVICGSIAVVLIMQNKIYCEDAKAQRTAKKNNSNF